MKRERYGSQLWLYPLPVVVIGAQVKGKPTFTTVAWVTPIEDEPPLVLAAIAKECYLLSEYASLESFSLNMFSADKVEKVDFCGLVSGYECDKSRVFEVGTGVLGTPLVEEAMISLECRVREWLDRGTSCLLVVGEVIETYAYGEYVKDGKPDIARMQLLSYLTKRGEYWTLGEKVAKARHVGLSLVKEKEK